jgi:hypothetical protein
MIFQQRNTLPRNEDANRGTSHHQMGSQYGSDNPWGISGSGRGASGGWGVALAVSDETPSPPAPLYNAMAESWETPE